MSGKRPGAGSTREEQRVRGGPAGVAWARLPVAAGQPVISLTGPSQRTTPGNSVPFNCTAGPFSSKDFNVTWLKDSDEHPATTQFQMANDTGRYFVTSKAWVPLTRKEVLSRITCQVAHRDLAEPLQMTLNLSQVLQVIPTLKIRMEHIGARVLAQQRVNLTCLVSGFYPSYLQLTWMENRHTIPTVEQPQVMRNPDGTYSLEHTLQAEATLNGSEFSCWVVQDEQPPILTNITLRAQAPNRGKGRIMIPTSHNVEGPRQRSEPGTSIQLTYTSSGLHTRQLNVTWLKNNHKLPTSKTDILSSGDTYNVTSRVLVPLEYEDLLSLVLCQVKHRSSSIFQKPISLNQFLRVPPTVTVSQSSTASGLVAVTCHVQKFYPQNMYLTWLEDCHVLKGTAQPKSKQNEDGSYTSGSLHLVNVSGQRSERLVTCRVQHQEQPPIQASLVLSTAPHPAHQPFGSPGPETSTLTFVAFLLGMKVMLLVSFTVTYICRSWRL
ncbi:Signal-regulatory protein beta-1 isoform 3 [Sciurus carolinensis]|uniref:Signal-regulatory protein beta-1 isoform 3 n=1 Tax=Sciurus carolinensis TaxID=30640 RepID=A0AA41ND12_SCICA|nr:Signal-regulatory protein beta-1 isoform 3 [Sciurus carolinensis]